MEKKEYYNEFGDYIGPDVNQDLGEADEPLIEEEQQEPQMEEERREDVDMEQNTENQIVLHEDKQYYQDAEELYKGAEILV